MRLSHNPSIIPVIGEKDTRPEITLLTEEIGQKLPQDGTVFVFGGLSNVMETAGRRIHTGWQNHPRYTP